MDVQAAIDLLIDSNEDVTKQIQSQIVELEFKLQRLKRALRVLAQANGEHKAARRSTSTSRQAATADGQLPYWNELEQRIYDIVNINTEKLTCKDLGERLKLNYTSIGKAINKSQRLAKEGSYIVVLS